MRTHLLLMSDTSGSAVVVVLLTIFRPRCTVLKDRVVIRLSNNGTPRYGRVGVMV